MNKNAQVIDTEVLFSPAFFIFVILGLGVFLIQLMAFKKMEFSMIWWVKIAIPIGIVVAAYFFAWRNLE